MKKALLAGFIFSACLAKAQGPQQLVDVPYDYWAGATVKGWLYLPADYNTSTKNYPVVFFYHGLGEAGSNPNVLLNQGIPNLIANGMRPDNITNPADGQQYSFIVLSVQHWSWSPNPAWLPYELEWLKNNYRIDTNRVYVTGLSAGGQMSFSVAAQNAQAAKLIAAAVPMSPAQVWPYDPTLVGENKIKTWFFSGNSDGGYTVNATNYNADCNIQYPNSSKLNIYSGGHCCWNNFYSTAWHDPVTGHSVWEWMLTNVREDDTPLPVNFVSVDVKQEAHQLRIHWKVGDEIDVQRYELERSNNARDFITVGNVTATRANEYSIIDAPSAGRVYYRVKSVDFDGSYGYSSVVSFTQEKTTVLLKAFPLPARNELKLQHPTSVQGSRILVNAADGRLVKSVQPVKGVQQTPVDLSNTPPGIYFIRYEDGNGLFETLRITKQ